MLSAKQARDATVGTLLSGDPGQVFRAVSTDTRTIEPGDLYVPLKGETFDAHAFVPGALEKGAIGFLWGEDHADPDFEWPESTVVITVPDTLKAYADLARFWRRQVNCTVIAVTGSSGKTSTKEFVAEALRRNWRVVKTEANFNNEIGVPRTLLELRPGDQVCVVEMGMRGAGQIAQLCDIAEPDVGLITMIGPAHLEMLGSMDAIAAAKWELADYLCQVGGVLIVNGDDGYLRGLAGVLPSGQLRWTSVDPTNDWADFVAVAQWLDDGKQAFRYRDKAGVLRTATLSLVGEHQVSNALLAIATSAHLGMTLPAEFPLLPSPLAGRGEELKLKEVVFVNEAYNANPASMRATLQSFAKLPGAGRKFAVLGDMRELGPESAQLHREVGEVVACLPIDMLITVGRAARDIAAGAIETSYPTHAVRQLEDSVAAANVLLAELKPGDKVLLKASRAVRLEDVLIEVRNAWDPAAT